MKKIFLIFLLFTTVLLSDEESILDYRKNISEFYYRFLDSSTSFLYKKSNYEYIKKHNKLKIYLNSSLDENGHFDFSPSIRASIKLPKISKNLYLNVEKESKITDNPNEEKTPKINEEKRSRIGLKYFFINQNDLKTFAKLGGRPTLSGSKIYIQGGIEQLFEFSNNYFFTYFLEDYYFKDKIFVSNLGVNYKKRLNEDFIFLQNNNLRLEDKQNTSLNNSFIIEQYISPTVDFTYWINLYSIKENIFKLNSISYNFKYHKMLKKWIFVDIIPSLVKNHNEKRDYDKYLYINFGFIF